MKPPAGMSRLIAYFIEEKQSWNGPGRTPCSGLVEASSVFVPPSGARRLKPILRAGENIA